MLALASSEDFVAYESGFGIAPTVTRYHGEYWDKTAADLVCGVGDPFSDVGIVTTAPTWEANLKTVEAAAGSRWVPITSPNRRNHSVWSISVEHGWLFVPWSREGVEDVMKWTMPYVRDGQATEGSLTTVFQGNKAFRDHLDTHDWGDCMSELMSFVKRTCLDNALFTMKWGWAMWKLFPAKIDLNQLVKLADPVVARINAVNTD